MKRLKLLVWGDSPTVPTGFARVCESVVKFLPPYYETVWLGINASGDPHNLPYRIYPAFTRGDIYGGNRLGEIVAKERPDIIFIVNDAWVQDTFLSIIKEVYKGKPRPKIISYVPVDAKDHDPEWYQNFDIVDHVVAYTEFGKAEILKARPELEDRISVIPHGIDTNTFYKIPGTKQEIKRELLKKPELEDSFIILNASRNQPRKRIDLTMEAFKIFSDGKPENVKLYLHMGLTDSHINLHKMAARLGIEGRLLVSTLAHGAQSIPVDKLNMIYNACDVGVNTSLGEGFSLTNIEHAITGAPQVVPNHSALTELYDDCGLLVPADTKFVLDNIMTTGYLVKPEDVAHQFEVLYSNPELYNFLSGKGINKFLDPKYQWQTISGQFRSLFER